MTPTRNRVTLGTKPGTIRDMEDQPTGGAPARRAARPRRARYDAWDAQRVRALRRHLGYTQQQLSDELGTRQQTVSEWETGMYQPRGASARLLSLIAERAAFRYGDDDSGGGQGEGGSSSYGSGILGGLGPAGHSGGSAMPGGSSGLSGSGGAAGPGGPRNDGQR